VQLSIKGAVIAGALLWGGALLVSGLLNLVNANYAMSFLGVMSSIYPGFVVSHTLGSVFVGTLYGLVDGALGGFFFAWLYNAFAR